VNYRIYCACVWQLLWITARLSMSLSRDEGYPKPLQGRETHSISHVVILSVTKDISYTLHCVQSDSSLLSFYSYKLPYTDHVAQCILYDVMRVVSGGDPVRLNVCRNKCNLVSFYSLVFSAYFFTFPTGIFDNSKSLNFEIYQY